MKILLFALLFSQMTFAAAAKKKPKVVDISADKTYSVEKTSPEIIIGVKEDLALKNKNIYKRPTELWYAAIVRTGLRYHLPSYTGDWLTFSPSSVGFTFGKKTENQFFLYKGHFEISAEWQRFSRQALVGNNSLYSQKLDLYQINIFQNFNLAWTFKHSVLFTIGLGLAPVYLTTEQSVFSNSSSELGYLVIFKTDAIIPLKQNLEIDIALKVGQGTVGSHDLSVLALNLGLNFE
jgi:hypothetical protein